MKTLTRETIAAQDSKAFNLGGQYDDHGQRCAAADIGDGLVYFVDIARGLDYFFQCDFSVSAIRHAYLNNQSVHVALEDYGTKNELRRNLEALALSAPSIS